MIGGMHATGFRVDHQRQLVGVGRLQFRQTAILKNHLRQRVVQRQFFQYFFRSGRRATRRFLQRLDALLFKQDGLQLFW